MKSHYKRLGDYIREVNVRNRDLAVTKLLGVSIQKVFMPSIANTIGTDMVTYKIVEKGQFGYGPVTSRNGDKVSIALLTEYDNAIISQAYTVFEVIDREKLLPEYLMMWFRRAEFDRYARFKSHGSAREIFDWGELCDIQLPIPAIEVQRKVVLEYESLSRRISLNESICYKLEQAAAALYRKTFIDNIDPQNLPHGWRMGILEEVSECITAGAIPTYVDKGEYYVLGQKCVNNNKIDLRFARFHTPKQNCPFLKYGDILINSTGSGTLGRVGQILFHPTKLSFDSNMTLVRAIDDCYIDYLGCFLSTQESFFTQISQGSTSQTRLYCSMVRIVKIVIPNTTLLKEFSLKVRCIKNMTHLIQIEVELLNQMSKVLLSKLATN